MSDKELIELIDDLALVALKCELAKQNFENAKEELEKVSSKFNSAIDTVSSEVLLNNQEFAYKVELAKKVFDAINVGKMDKNI